MDRWPTKLPHPPSQQKASRPAVERPNKPGESGSWKGLKALEGLRYQLSSCLSAGNRFAFFLLHVFFGIKV